ncbi:MAG TPA: TetR/AcrR family transcriptional regulator [Rubrobacter sp.]|jgi:AcrR family transcriptional regulator|nr:TetR/AcrR family transcriptional regulator [Rubrobacter sp.]
MSSGESETRTRILEATRRLTEEHRGQGVRMRDVAEAAGVSRQAVYDHFGSRAKLLVETTHYVDGVRGLEERRRHFREATTGVGRLEAYVEFWGNYIPEVYGMAKALLVARETDEAAAAAWDDRMSAVRESCRRTIEALHREGMLAPEWSRDVAVDLMWTMLSIRNWEQLTTECGWSTNQYVSRMQELLKRTFVRGSHGT